MPIGAGDAAEYPGTWMFVMRILNGKTSLIFTIGEGFDILIVPYAIALMAATFLLVLLLIIAVAINQLHLQ